VLPGERLTAETLAYIARTLELGGSVRGASDRRLRTIRVAVR
jgi:arginine/lysine/ornithine decarboxylase